VGGWRRFCWRFLMCCLCGVFYDEGVKMDNGKTSCRGPGNFSYIADDFRHGDNVQVGQFCVIEPDVIVGDNVSLGHFVTLKPGTRIGNNVELADYCKTTGLCIIGNNVMVRTGSCVSKGVIVNDWVLIGAGVMTNHTKNIYHGRPDATRKQLITQIGYGAVVGSASNLTAGVEIAPGAIVGYRSSVVGDLLTDHGIYLDRPHPVATLQRWLEPWESGYINVPDDYEPYEFDQEMLEKYLPYV
jgi:acetyltransferase-like isoleucine patch superfamily enzyme